MVNVSYKAPKVQEIISEAMIAIVTKDFSKLLPKIIESLPDLIQVVLGCINEKTAIEDEPKAKLWLKDHCWNYRGILYRPECKCAGNMLPPL